MRLKDRVAIVTGGGDGIGRATCELFAEEGASVFLCDLNEESATETASAIAKAGGVARAIRADVSTEAECQRVVEECASAYGRVDILVNNAAAFVLKSLDATPEDWRRVMETNVFGYAYLMRFAAEEMKKQGSGCIVNLASMSSVIAQPNLLTYNASKGAVIQITRCAALDLAPHSIRVYCVCPGVIWTGQVRRMAAQQGMTKEQASEWLGASNIIKRVGEPREVAYSILFLASDESTFCTGSALFVDGGYTTQ
jgi:dihydroanticapsin dehydrogenase